MYLKGSWASLSFWLYFWEYAAQSSGMSCSIIVLTSPSQWNLMMIYTIYTYMYLADTVSTVTVAWMSVFFLSTTSPILFLTACKHLNCLLKFIVIAYPVLPIKLFYLGVWVLNAMKLWIDSSRDQSVEVKALQTLSSSANV